VLASDAGRTAAGAVRNIGLHIGGGPNDDENKAPILNSVAPHLSEFAPCLSQSQDAAVGGDFGVDLMIPAKGGIAEVSNPRATLRGAAFRACVVKVFEAIVFERPLRGKTMASYSIRFSGATP
jgi:hypothetical protein